MAQMVLKIEYIKHPIKRSALQPAELRRGETLHKYQFIVRLCSFPSPNYFIKPCDMHDTIKPFCYTRLNEVFSLISNHFAGSEGGNENQYCRKAGTLVMATRIGDTVR